MTTRTFFRRSASEHDGRLIDGLLLSGAAAAHGPAAHRAELDRHALALAVTDPAVDSAGRLSARLVRTVARLHTRGWEPDDVVHVVGRHCPQRVQRLAGAVVVHQAGTVRVVPPPEWAAQLAGLGADLGPGVVGAWFRQEGVEPVDAWRDGLRLLGVLETLGPLEVLRPGPADWGRTVRAAGSPTPEPKVLARVRALLAKAESTSFPDEADALTAKAQELISRHALDEAMLDAHAGTGSEVVARRVHVDNPYAAARAQLLDAVGRVNEVRMVWIDSLGIATLVGHPGDLDRTELLFASLLVQATRALAVAARQVTAKSFRRAFLVSYAIRIGERLEQVRDTARSDAELTYGTELVPVLAERSAAVEQAFTTMFPRLRTPRRTRVDALGWHAWRAAAEEADLGG